MKTVVVACYAFSIPALIDAFLLVTNTEIFLYIPKILINIYIVSLVIAGVCRTGFFRGLGFYFFFDLLMLAFQASGWHYMMIVSGLGPFIGATWLGIFSSYAVVASTGLLTASALLVDSFSNKTLRVTATALASLFLIGSLAHSSLLFYVQEFCGSPVNINISFFVAGDTIFLTGSGQATVRVAEYGLTDGKQKTTREFDIEGTPFIRTDETGQVFLVTRKLFSNNISVYNYPDAGKPVFEISAETHGCENRITSLGDNFLFDPDGSFNLACYDGAIQKYSRDGVKLAEFEVMYDDEEYMKRFDENSHSAPIILMGFAIDDEGNYYTALRDGYIKKYSPTGEELATLKFGEGSETVYDISFSGDGNLYASFAKVDRQKDWKKLVVRAFDTDGNLLSERVIYEGTYTGDSPWYFSIEATNPDRIVLEKTYGGTMGFSQFIIINGEGETILTIPPSQYWQRKVMDISMLNEKLIEALHLRKSLFDATLDMLEDLNPDFDADGLRKDKKTTERAAPSNRNIKDRYD